MHARPWLITDFNKSGPVQVHRHTANWWWAPMTPDIFQFGASGHNSLWTEWRKTYEFAMRTWLASGRCAWGRCSLYLRFLYYLKREQKAVGGTSSGTGRPTLCYYRINGIVALDGTCANLQRTFRLNAGRTSLFSPSKLHTHDVGCSLNKFAMQEWPCQRFTLQE